METERIFCISVKYLDYLRKRMNTNPKRGPYHFRAPSKIFWKAVRGRKICFSKSDLNKLISFLEEDTDRTVSYRSILSRICQIPYRNEMEYASFRDKF